MRLLLSILPSLVLFTLALIHSAAANYSPFYSPFNGNTYLLSDGDRAAIEKRQSGNCEAGLISCSALGAADTCCPSGQNCALDQAGNVACCPVGASCTGSIRGATQTGSTGTSISVVVIGGSGTTTATATVSTSSTSFLFGGTTATTATTTTTGGAVTITGSTVPNALFPFVIIPTTFSNAAECSSYYTGCLDQFTRCTSTLGQGVNGITVSAANGGTTVNGVTAAAAAASVCSSLSTAACFGLQESICATFGGATGTAGTATITGNNFVVSTGAAARPNRCAGSFYEIGMGVAVGFAGVML